MTVPDAMKDPKWLNFALSVCALVMSMLSFRDAQHAKVVARDMYRPALEIGFGEVTRSLRDPRTTYVDVLLKNVGHSTARLTTISSHVYQFAPNSQCLVHSDRSSASSHDEIPPSVTLRAIISTTALSDCPLPKRVLSLEVEVVYEAVASHDTYRQRYVGVASERN